VFSLFSVFFIGADLIKQEGGEDDKTHNIIDSAWADDINGTENADNITGTTNKDVIKGLNGNDTLAGKEAGDDISGGDGDDIIYGNDGRDVLWGKAGNDHLEGAEGNDRIYGDRGNDTLMGGPGNDTLIGGQDRDIFICGTATDTITDFNLTQKDTTPENDCEIIKNGSNGNGKVNQKLSVQQQNDDSNLGNANIKKVKTVANTTTPTIDEQKKPDSGFFFDLFK
jgi:Ca2+-binding RTX toxin-like protein